MPVTLSPPFDPATIQTNAKLASALAPSLAIFPCDENKEPVYGTPWKSARPGQIDRVQRWWSAHPDAMPGIHLGAVGLIVMDADGAEGIAAFERICEQHGGVPECPMVDTPSGGRHYYFRQLAGEKLGNSRGSLPPKSECPIDVRGDGGYVIAPDATRDDGVYLYPDGDPLDILHAPELPDWLHDILTGKREEITPEPLPQKAEPAPKPSKEITPGAIRTLDMGHPRLRAWVESAFDAEIKALEGCGSGGRNNQLNTSAFAVFQLVAAGWVAEDVAHGALVQAAEACGLVKDDGRRSVLRTIASARKGGMAQPRQVPEEFQRDEEIAATAVELNRELAVSADGTIHDATTGEVIEPEPASDYEEFPEHLTYVPGLLGELVDWITETAIYPSRMMALGAAMTLVGTAMGRNWCGPTGSSTVLYIMALAPTGTGKDHPIQAIRRILKMAELKRLVGENEFTGGPAIENQVKRSPLCLCPMDEFGAFMSRLLSRKSGNFERQATKALRELWSTKYGEYQTTGRAQSEGTIITAAHLSIYGASIHEELFDALSGNDVANGFLNRFLFLSTRRRPPANEPTLTLQDTPASLTRALFEVCGNGEELKQGTIMNPIADIAPFKVEWATDTARLAFKAFQGEVDRRAQDNVKLAPFLGRTAEMAVRMATIRAMGRNKLKPAVSLEDFEWARDVALWSACAMAHACGLYISETAAQADANRILRVVRDMGGRCTRAMVNRALRGIMRRRDLDDTWKVLIEAELLVPLGGVKATNGRNIDWYQLASTH